MANNNKETPTLEMNNNSPKRFARSAKSKNNQREMEIKTWFIQLLYSNLFIEMDHEYPHQPLSDVF